jgi:transcriptional regulator with XRE-family HTH domain
MNESEDRTVRKEKQQALEAAGMRFTTVAEFLGLTPEEEALVELRVAVSVAARRARERNHLTQAQIARRIKSSQSRVNLIESGAPDVSLDLMFRGLFAAGGTLSDVLPTPKPKASRIKKKRSPCNQGPSRVIPIPICRPAMRADGGSAQPLPAGWRAPMGDSSPRPPRSLVRSA